MAQFHPLTVSDIRRETRDSVVVTLEPNEDVRDEFQYVQGQHLTFRREFDGEELRRSYSICAGLDEEKLRIGIKRIDGGCFSTWANEALKVGDTLEALPPIGTFHTPLNVAAKKHYLYFAGGSGITPILSIVKTTLTREPHSKVTLVYGNRSINSIMFREELEDIKDEYLGRFSVIHVLENEAQDIELFSGRIDSGKCAALFKSWIDIKSVDMAFICGPEPMMLAIAASLRKHGLEDQQIKFELFASSQQGRAKRKAKPTIEAGQYELCSASIILDGTMRVLEIPKGEISILEAAQEASLDVPYSCKAGVCSTCRAKVIEGEVEMEANFALEDHEVRRGYVLTCQSYPLTDKVVIDYDQ